MQFHIETLDGVWVKGLFLVATSTKVSAGSDEACSKECCVFLKKKKRRHNVLQKLLKHSSHLKPHITLYHGDPTGPAYYLTHYSWRARMFTDPAQNRGVSRITCSLICEENMVPMADLPSLVFFGKCSLKLLWEKKADLVIVDHATFMESDSLGGNMYTRSSWRALVVLHLVLKFYSLRACLWFFFF